MAYLCRHGKRLMKRERKKASKDEGKEEKKRGNDERSEEIRQVATAKLPKACLV